MYTESHTQIGQVTTITGTYLNDHPNDPHGIRVFYKNLQYSIHAQSTAIMMFMNFTILITYLTNNNKKKTSTLI